MILCYLIIAFIITFWNYKKYWKKMIKASPFCHLESKYGWYVYIVPIFWLIAIPLILSWNTLEYIYDKINKEENN